MPAITVKITPKKASVPIAPASNKIKSNVKSFALPTAPIEPIDQLGAYSWMIYGQKKIGKSSLAGQFPDAFFFMFEPGAKALRIRRVDIGKWEDALGYLDTLEKSPGYCKTVVIDTGFEAYQKCIDFKKLTVITVLPTRISTKKAAPPKDILPFRYCFPFSWCCFNTFIPATRIQDQKILSTYTARKILDLYGVGCFDVQRETLYLQTILALLFHPSRLGV